MEGDFGNRAPLTNLALCHQTLQALTERELHLPGLGTFTGPSGFGKTFAAAYTTVKTNAVYVEARSFWTTRVFFELLLRELGETRPPKTVGEMGYRIADLLIECGRPVIIDEADHIVNKRFVEAIRDIYEASQSPILLIGEEALPERLLKWERFHNRILIHKRAEPATFEDAQLLRDHYIREKVAIDDDLVEHIRAECRGVVRRIVINLEAVRQETLTRGEGGVATLASFQRWGMAVNKGRAEARRLY